MHFVGNRHSEVQRHFQGLKEAIPRLRGLAFFDRLEEGRPAIAPVQCLMWRRREIENYLCSRATLEAYAQASAQTDVPEPLLTQAEAGRRLAAMREAIDEMTSARELRGEALPWDPDSQVSDSFLRPLFQEIFRQIEASGLDGWKGPRRVGAIRSSRGNRSRDRGEAGCDRAHGDEQIAGRRENVREESPAGRHITQPVTTTRDDG